MGPIEVGHGGGDMGSGRLDGRYDELKQNKIIYIFIYFYLDREKASTSGDMLA